MKITYPPKNFNIKQTFSNTLKGNLTNLSSNISEILNIGVRNDPPNTP